MLPRISITTRRNDVVGPLSTHHTELLTQAPDTLPARNFLEQLHHRQEHLRCQCGLRFHVCQAGTTFLRRNPNQSQTCSFPCSLGEGHVQAAAAQVGPVERLPNRPLGLLLYARSTGKSGPDPPKVSERNGTVVTQKYPGLFHTLFRLLADLGYTGWSGEPGRWEKFGGWDRFWAAFHQRLSETRITPSSRLTMADISWLPFRACRGGLAGLTQRVARGWDVPGYRPEAWIFGILDAFPTDDTIAVHPFSQGHREYLSRMNKPVFRPYTFGIEPQRMAAIGQTGPFLMLAVGTLPPKLNEFSKPAIHRVALQSIASSEYPLPVESSYERQVARLLRALEIPFRKPIFPEEGDLRPDFVCWERVILECQGMNLEGYREHKAEIHRRMLASPRYRNCVLVRYDPNDGETLESLKHKLFQAKHGLR
ncbi:MAG: GxxExxY protein [Blastocatellia bacterium]|nr:GxxExxY protein [Blastocatellia bacterium]